MTQDVWKVGELAEQTGVTVRTLHYCDEIGLLSPSQRTGSGRSDTASFGVLEDHGNELADMPVRD